MLREFSSGGVVYKKVKEREGERVKVLWLIAASAPSELFPKVVWRLPKGWIDNDTSDTTGPMASGKVKADEQSLQKAALREVAEEGGVNAKIIKKIGTEKYFFKHPERGQILKFVTFYVMEYVSDIPEGHDAETSEVVWLPFDEAHKKISYSNEKEILTQAKNLL